MKLGIEVLLADPKRLKALKGKRLALICHPASVDQRLRHSFDLLHEKLGLSSAFGPQHGVRGDKQDNMIETADQIDAQTGIPIFSLYGKVRRPTAAMMSTFDIAIFDLQDLGCRIYTFITTLLYVMEECARLKKKMIILDRPNPAGREVEGFTLIPGWESFVGAGPIPMRHGLTVGELAHFFNDHFALGLDLTVVPMKGYRPSAKPGFGWPPELPWINPSPNAATLNMARAYPGTVLIEGTNLSEGRGTTRALELVGAADVDFSAVVALMQKKAPQSNIEEAVNCRPRQACAQEITAGGVRGCQWSLLGCTDIEQIPTIPRGDAASRARSQEGFKHFQRGSKHSA